MRDVVRNAGCSSRRTDDSAQSVQMPADDRRSDTVPPRVLVVEDEGVVAADIRLTLRDLGYTVIATISSAEKAVEVALTQLPDLILMDIHTKGSMDGVQAAKLIREKAPIPVVFLTAHGDAETAQRARAAEPLGYVVKPFKELDLRNAIELALQRSVNERKMSDPAGLLALESARLLTLVAHLSIGVVIEEEGGRLRHVNAQLVRLLAGNADAAPARIDTMAELGPYFVEPLRALSTLESLRQAAGVQRAVLKTRRGHAIELCRLPVATNDRKGGALWTFTDVTARELEHEKGAAGGP